MFNQINETICQKLHKCNSHFVEFQKKEAIIAKLNSMLNSYDPLFVYNCNTMYIDYIPA